MFSTVNILLTFLILKIVSGQQQVRYGDKYRRNEELSNTPPDHKPQQQKVDPSANFQLLVPADPSNVIIENADDIQPIPPEEDPKLELNANPNPDGQDKLMSKQTSFHNKLLSPFKVSYMQEKTALQWPRGTIPYFIDTETYDHTTIRRIVKTMGIVESSSCVIFKELKRPKDSNDAWLHITNPGQERECVHEFSHDGAGRTVVVLGFECLHPDEILHSLLHAIGLKDEVSHPHRDQYIRILWENIQPKYRPLFRIQFEDAAYKLVEYDPMSSMHFHDRAFSANGAATIAPVISGLQIGPSSALSPLDIMKLKLAFGHECNKRKIGDLLDTCKNALSSKKRVKLGIVENAVEEEAESTKNEASDTYKEEPPVIGQNLKEDEGATEKKHKSNYEDAKEGAQQLKEDDLEKINEEDYKMNLNEEVEDASIKHLNSEDNTEIGYL